MITYPQYRDACQAIIEAAKASRSSVMLQFAAAYAEEGLRADTLEKRQAQALYMLINLGSWRGEEAKRVKKMLKEFCNG